MEQSCLIAQALGYVPKLRQPQPARDTFFTRSTVSENEIPAPVQGEVCVSEKDETEEESLADSLWKMDL